MPVTYQAEFRSTNKNNVEELSLVRTLPDGTVDTSLVDLNEIHELEMLTRDFKWNQSPGSSRDIGKRLFAILNGDSQLVLRALNEAEAHGESLQLILRTEGPASHLPFELLYDTEFLVPSKAHLIRRVSDRGSKKKPEPADRPLKIMFMACSPLNAFPTLAFEKEEDALFDVTKDLPVEIDVEDTGSSEGLGERLARNEYDVVHLTGHADIDNEGNPFFLMEDEEGLSVPVTPMQLWDKLTLNPPRLLFLSACRTGEAPEHLAALSFAHQLVAGHVSTVLGWGLPVTDVGARHAAKTLYHDLSRGKNIIDAVFRTRQELFRDKSRDWSLLRLFSDGTPLDVALVKGEQKKRPKLRELQYTYLATSHVKVLEKGFIGRRRQIQQGLRSLIRDSNKVGLLLHGTGGLGKSCLAGKFCDRFKDHDLIIVPGELNAVTFREALKDGFMRADDDEGLKKLGQPEELPDVIRKLCSSIFQNRSYLIVLDDFEKNMPRAKEGIFDVSKEAAPILDSLLRFLPYSRKMTQLIITSRHTFTHTFGGADLVKERLEPISLASFRDADERKKVFGLKHIFGYPDLEIRQKLIDAGRGNPRLMEALDTLVGEAKGLDVISLLSRVKDKQAEFVQELVLRELMKTQPEEFQTSLRRSAVYRLPVLKEGVGLVCKGLEGWESHVENAVRLTLMEKDTTRRPDRYWVTPLFREDIFGELSKVEREKCHEAATSYYKTLLSTSRYDPILGLELIDHALEAGLDDIVIEEGGRYLPYLRNTLAYTEALTQGQHILLHVSKPKRDANYAKFLIELGWFYHDTGEHKKAIEYCEQALSIDKDVYGDRHPDVAAALNNIGEAWRALGEPKKAIEYYDQALSIDEEVYGDRHPDVAAALNNIGLAWHALGEHKKAIEYLEQALSIVREVYGEKHPHVAVTLNNIGMAWDALGEHKKAIEYYDQGLSIDKDVYGDRHPKVATRLNNIGGAWYALGDSRRAKSYFLQAYHIFKEFYGDEHPSTRTVKEWLDLL